MPTLFVLGEFFEDNQDTLQKDFDALTPLERMHFRAKILPYLIPKFQAVPDDLMAGRGLKYDKAGNPFYEEENIEITFDLGDSLKDN